MKLNLAARAGRWSASHWKTATFGWIAFVLVAVVLGGAIGTKTLGAEDTPGESGRMERILEAGFDKPARESAPRSTCRRASCVASSATCTTARRPASWRSA